MALLSWISKVDGALNTFVVDPDIFYPEFLAELGVEKHEVTQYWLEIAFACMKMDFDVSVRMERAADPARRIIRMVRADEGRKARWNLTMFKHGKKDWSKMGLQERSRDIRKHYRRIRGFVPS